METDMNSTPKCSVIIPTYNRAALLRVTLGSLLRQTMPPAEFEVLVCDDGSTDETPEVVREFAGRLRIRSLRQADEGFRAARARNLGIAAAQAEICVFADTGMLLHSGFLAAHLARHHSTPEPLAVCGYAFCFNLDNEDAALISRTIDADDPDASIETMRRTGQWLDIREEFYAKYTDDFADLPAPWMIFWACNASAGTEQLRRVGMFDEQFRTWGGEDVELGYRLHRDGARLVMDRDAAAIHCPHDKVLGDNLVSVADNFRYMGRKFRTPITEFLAAEPLTSPFVFNDVVRERGLPRCADHVAAQSVAARQRG
jgi:glycosyltransferase involved in cell wall biosynthesis